MNEYEFAKALSHPLRVAILKQIGSRKVSPSTLARELNEPLTHVSYHVRKLASLRALREQPVVITPAGLVEHYYRRDTVALRKGIKAVAQLF